MIIRLSRFTNEGHYIKETKGGFSLSGKNDNLIILSQLGGEHIKIGNRSRKGIINADNHDKKLV